MQPIKLFEPYNYCAVFLTLACNLKCSYCINLMNDYDRRKIHHGRPPMSAGDWITALQRIEASEDLPITLQGGEPTVHPYFYDIVQGIEKPMDLLTNVQFDIEKFIRLVPTHKFRRAAPYASIRVSYHPEQMQLADTVSRVKSLLDAGYQVGVWSVLVPEWETHIKEVAQPEFLRAGIDFRLKEMMDGGNRDGTQCGTYKYPDSVGAKILRSCLCRTTELLVAPDGSVHRCHSDLYNLRRGIGHILDKDFKLDREFRECAVYGDCSGCDVKITTNRHSIPGWTSVEIKDINPPVLV